MGMVCVCLFVIFFLLLISHFFFGSLCLLDLVTGVVLFSRSVFRCIFPFGVPLSCFCFLVVFHIVCSLSFFGFGVFRVLRVGQRFRLCFYADS